MDLELDDQNTAINRVVTSSELVSDMASMRGNDGNSHSIDCEENIPETCNIAQVNLSSCYEVAGNRNVENINNTIPENSTENNSSHETLDSHQCFENSTALGNSAPSQESTEIPQTVGTNLNPGNNLSAQEILESPQNFERDTSCNQVNQATYDSLDTPSFSENVNPEVSETAGEDYAMETETQNPFIPQELPDSRYSFLPTSTFTCIHTATKEFMKCREENFLKGCKWSPDGTQILTNSNDNTLRIFTPSNDDVSVCSEMSPSCEMKESGLIYDYCWHPSMYQSIPETCRVACSCPGSPIHLWDSCQRRILSSYRAFDHCDELTSAYSLSFSQDGAKLYGGYKSCIRIFDTEYSHRKCFVINTFDSKQKEGHKGIISCFSHGPPESRLFVAGSYNRHVGIYHSLTNELLCLIQGQQGGVTQVMLSPDGSKLYTGGRKDPEIVCWDMRNMGHILGTYLRDVQTNQRVYFDLSQSGRYLMSGNHDGSVQVWDTSQPGQEVGGEVLMKPCYTFQAHLDCTNGISLNPSSPLLATASGQRHFGHTESETDSDTDDSGMSRDSHTKDFSLKIWTIPCIS